MSIQEERAEWAWEDCQAGYVRKKDFTAEVQAERYRQSGSSAKTYINRRRKANGEPPLRIRTSMFPLDNPNSNKRYRVVFIVEQDYEGKVKLMDETLARLRRREETVEA